MAQLAMNVDSNDARRAPANPVDVWHEVPLVPQLTGMSCWAAAAAMVIGWRDRSALDAVQIARSTGKWEAYQHGLEPADVPTLAREWGLSTVAAGRHSVRDFARLLEDNGPLWVGEASPGLHSVVVSGMSGDNTLDGTIVHIADPWPAGRGERYHVTFRQFMENVQAAADLEGVDVQILHAGGRAGRVSNGHTGGLDFEDMLPLLRQELDCPLLRSHGGPGPNLILHWNFRTDIAPLDADLSKLDVVVHLHGYRAIERGAMRLPSVEVMSGLDFGDPHLPPGEDRTRVRPTLAILPRGKWIGDQTYPRRMNDGSIVDTPYRPDAYAFPALTGRQEALDELIRYALDWFASTQLLRSDPNTLDRARLILTAHSGGGSALEKILGHENPDEVHAFDALYSDAPNLAAWAIRRLRADAVALGISAALPVVVPSIWDDEMHASGGAMRAFYRIATDTAAHTAKLACALSDALRALPDRRVAEHLARYYRVGSVERSRLEHNAMPPTLGWQLLVDASADVDPAMSQPPDSRDTSGMSRRTPKENPMSNSYVSKRGVDKDVVTMLADRVAEHVGPDVRARLRARPDEVDTIARTVAGAIRAQVAATAPQARAAEPRRLVRPLGWAADTDSPDYSHLGNVPGMSSAFTLDATVLEVLCDLNSFDVTTDADGTGVVLFGLRGCAILEGGNGAFVPSVSLTEDMPDHEANHCVLGVWKRTGVDAGKIAVVRGSTVPTRKFVKAFAADPNSASRKCNMLLTGRLPFVIGDHRRADPAHHLRGVFHEGSDQVVVIRSRDDEVYTTTDLFEAANPGDNIHPSRHIHDDRFSSKGCQTIPGSGNDAGDQFDSDAPPGWVTFRRRAGLTAATAPASENGRRFTYVLLTGREARLVAQNQSTDPAMRRLRFGSSGTRVEDLQNALGLSLTGTMDAATTMAWITEQQRRNAGKADGIVRPADAASMGFSL
jgi:Papain-like cysteine protease AvrRpt2